jgi:outer membrane cobalamin receptor
VVVTRQGNITVVEIKNNETFSVDDLASRLPEIEVVGSGAQKFIRIRGADLNGVEIKLNGRKVNSVLSSKGDISSIPLGSVSRIEIVSGGDYNSKGLAGSVNFITSRPADDFHIATGAERGSYDRESYSARLSGLTLWKTSLRMDTENIFDRGDFIFIDPRDSVQSRANNFYHDKKLFGVIRHESAGSSLELDVRLFKRTSGSPGPIFQITPDARSDMFEREFALRFSRDFNRKSGMVISGGTTEREIRYDSPRTVFNFIAYNSTFKESSRDISARYQIKGKIDFDISGTIRYESLFGEDHIRPDAAFGKHARLTNSIQGGLVFRLPDLGSLNNSSSISAGYRREGGDDGDFNAPSATFRSVFDVFARPGFDVSISRSRRLPGLTDLFWKEDVFAEPNPDLESEKSIGYELGVDFEIQKSFPTRLRIARYFREFDDLIIWRRWAGNRFKPVNLSRAEISGWEYSLETSPFASPFTLFWTGSFIEPLNKEPEINHHDKYLTFRPIGTQTAGIRFSAGGIELILSGRHLGKRYQTEENTKSLPPVDLLDLRCGYSRTMKRLRITAGAEILNLGNKQYEILDRQPERPREYRIGIKLQNRGGSK